MKVVHICRQQSDLTEGRGHMIPMVAFDDVKDAVVYINGQKGIMGRPAPLTGWDHMHPDWDVIPIEIFDDLQELENYRSVERIRERALNKLTEEEIEALGL